MHLEQINQRLEDLYAVQQYCSEERKTFTIGERICISQEKGALFDRLNYLFNGKPIDQVRTYQVPDELEDKIRLVSAAIKASNFTAYPTTWFIKDIDESTEE